MSKKSIAFVAKNGAVDDAFHVAACCNLGGRDVNLIAVAIGVGDGGAVNYAIDASPERGAHAHGAGLAGGVEGVTGERNCLESFCSFADGADLGMGTGVGLLLDGVEGAQ